MGGRRIISCLMNFKRRVHVWDGKKHEREANITVRDERHTDAVEEIVYITFKRERTCTVNTASDASRTVCAIVHINH